MSCGVNRKFDSLASYSFGAMRSAVFCDVDNSNGNPFLGKCSIQAWGVSVADAVMCPMISDIWKSMTTVNTLRTRQNGHFTEDIFKNAFSWIKSFMFLLKFNCFLTLTNWYSSIYSDNGLAPARRQAIIRSSNDGTVYLHIYESLGLMS